MKDEQCDSADFKSATKFVARCLDKLEKGLFDIEENHCSNKFRVLGAGPTRRAIEVRHALFDYFIDVRSSLKGRLPGSVLVAKAKQIYDEYCEVKRQGGETPQELKFTNRWLN